MGGAGGKNEKASRGGSDWTTCPKSFVSFCGVRPT